VLKLNVIQIINVEAILLINGNYLFGALVVVGGLCRLILQWMFKSVHWPCRRQRGLDFVEGPNPSSQLRVTLSPTLYASFFGEYSPFSTVPGCGHFKRPENRKENLIVFWAPHISCAKESRDVRCSALMLNSCNDKRIF